ncbi:RNA-binding domain-containing protein, partial [Dacryopinax primogenitus]
MSSRSGHRVLYVVGFHSSTRAKDLAAGFGKFGKLVRCDIPMSKYINSQPYAFVEYCESEDADNAFKDMHNVHLDGALIKVEWARRAPSSIWRTEGPPGERGNDTRDYTNTASWDRHDHRKSDRDYRSEGDDDRRHRRDYETGRNEERRHEPRIFDREEDRSERVYHHGHERDYERDRDRDEHRTQ